MRVTRQFTEGKKNPTDSAGTTGYPHAEKKKEVGPNLTLHIKINSKWIKRLSVRAKTIKL